MAELYRDAGDGVFHNIKLFFIPNEVKNSDWQDFLIWQATNIEDPQRTLVQRRVLRTEQAGGEGKINVIDTVSALDDFNSNTFDMYVEGIQAHFDDLETQISVSSDPESIDIITGWPVYGI